MHLLSRIERHLGRYRVAPTRFGREAAGDPRLVFDLRNGRQAGTRVTARVLRHIEVRETEHASCE